MEKNSYSLQRNTGLIGRYVIQKVLGQGGFGITYLGIDKLYGNKVAIKEYYPQKIAMRKAQYEDVVTVTSIEEKNNYNKGKKRFLDEAQVMARFNKNEGIVKILDFFEANNTVYIIMKQLGEIITLKEFQKTVGSTEQFEVLKFLQCLLPVMNGIAALHRAGIIHCGIKPDRVIILNDSTMKLLLDTGTLRKFSIKDTSLPVIFDQHYALLEVYSTKGELGPWTDIYALCAAIYYYLRGDNPVEVIERISGKKLKKLSEYNISVFPELENVVLKGMSVDIKDRYQSMEEFCEALYGAANESLGF